MKKKSVTKNYIYNLSYQILVLIIPIITTPYISRALGAENIGIYSYTLSISAFFILFGSLGISLYAQREIAYLQKDKKKYSKLFWEILILKSITMTISLFTFFFTFVRKGDYSQYYKILTLEIIANCIDISWFFQGLEEFKKTVLRNIIVKILSLICIFTFVKKPEDLKIYFYIYALSILFGNGSLWLYLPKILEKVNFRTLKIRKHIKPTLSLFLPQIAIEVYTLLDRAMIGTIIAEKSEVGFYEQSQKIIKMLLTVLTSLGTVMLPRIANNFAKGNNKTIKTYIAKSLNMVLMLAFPMILGIISISHAFVPKFFGQGFDKVEILMNIISPIILFIGLSNVIGTQYLLPTKKQREYTISVVCGAITNFIANLCLIWKYGAIGASIGTVIAELTVTLVQLYYVRNIFSFLFILKLSKNYIISSIAMFLVCSIVRILIVDNMISSIALQVLSGTIVYVICLLVLKDKYFDEILNKINKIIKIKE